MGRCVDRTGPIFSIKEARSAGSATLGGRGVFPNVCNIDQFLVSLDGSLQDARRALSPKPLTGFSIWSASSLQFALATGMRFSNQARQPDSVHRTHFEQL
jgi:hypothetical protein